MSTATSAVQAHLVNHPGQIFTAADLLDVVRPRHPRVTLAAIQSATTTLVREGAIRRVRRGAFTVDPAAAPSAPPHAPSAAARSTSQSLGSLIDSLQEIDVRIDHLSSDRQRILAVLRSEHGLAPAAIAQLLPGTSAAPPAPEVAHATGANAPSAPPPRSTPPDPTADPALPPLKADRRRPVPVPAGPTEASTALARAYTSRLIAQYSESDAAQLRSHPRPPGRQFDVPAPLWADLLDFVAEHHLPDPDRAALRRGFWERIRPAAR